MSLKVYHSEEEKLIKQCCKDDRRAQQKLYNRYSSLMFGVCRRYICDADTAGEILVLGFTAAFQNISKYNFAGSFEGWLRRIMVNEALMHLRRNKKDLLSISIEEEWDAPSLDENVLEQMASQDLFELIDQLPLGYKTVFNLYAIEGFSHKEISEKLEINEGTSKSQLSKARNLLQKQLSQLGYQKYKQLSHEKG